MKKLAFAIAALFVVFTATSGAWANAVPQVTLSSSGPGSFVFGNQGGTLSFWLNGTISGNILLEPQVMVGRYTMSMTGTPSLTGGPSDYTVNMNGAVLTLFVTLNGHPDTLSAQLTLTDLFGGGGNTPGFDGTFASAATTGLYMTQDIPNGDSGTIDFIVKMPTGFAVSTLGNNQTAAGNISSGEVLPNVPEPSSLALMGTGVLSLAGLLRRKIM